MTPEQKTLAARRMAQAVADAWRWQIHQLRSAGYTEEDVNAVIEEANLNPKAID